MKFVFFEEAKCKRIRECVGKLQRNEKAKYRVEKISFIDMRVYFANVTSQSFLLRGCVKHKIGF